MIGTGALPQWKEPASQDSWLGRSEWIGGLEFACSIAGFWIIGFEMTCMSEAWRLGFNPGDCYITDLKAMVG